MQRKDDFTTKPPCPHCGNSEDIVSTIRELLRFWEAQKHSKWPPRNCMGVVMKMRKLAELMKESA